MAFVVSVTNCPVVPRRETDGKSNHTAEIQVRSALTGFLHDYFGNKSPDQAVVELGRRIWAIGTVELI